MEVEGGEEEMVTEAGVEVEEVEVGMVEEEEGEEVVVVVEVDVDQGLPDVDEDQIILAEGWNYYISYIYG